MTQPNRGKMARPWAMATAIARATAFASVAATAIAACLAPTPTQAATTTAPAGAQQLAAPPTATLVQPRPFGYMLGDILTQRVLLQNQGRPFDPASLPPAERIGVWLARRTSKIESTADGNRWLVMDYQLITSPQSLMTINLPALTIKANAGKAVLTIPPWPISINSMTPRESFAKGGLQDLRPDHPAPAIPTAALWRQLELWSAACALIILTWLAWWGLRSWRAAANQPFARAARQIRRADDRSPEAWLALHRAFDQTAGLALHLDTLPLLFQRARQLEPERAAIEQFYTESNARFFGPSQVTSLISVRGLCATLRRIEKRHEP